MTKIVKKNISNKKILITKYLVSNFDIGCKVVIKKKLDKQKWKDYDTENYTVRSEYLIINN